MSSLRLTFHLKTQLNDALNESYPDSRLVNSHRAQRRTGPGFARCWTARTQLIDALIESYEVP